MYYTHPGFRTSIFGKNCAYCIRDFTVNRITIFNRSAALLFDCFCCMMDTEAVDVCCRDFTISYLATDDTGEDVYLSLLSDWDLDAAFISASNPCLRLKVDLKPFEPGMIYQYSIYCCEIYSCRDLNSCCL